MWRLIARADVLWAFHRQMGGDTAEDAAIKGAQPGELWRRFRRRLRLPCFSMPQTREIKDCEPAIDHVIGHASEEIGFILGYASSDRRAFDQRRSYRQFSEPSPPISQGLSVDGTSAMMDIYMCAGAGSTGSAEVAALAARSRPWQLISTRRIAIDSSSNACDGEGVLDTLSFDALFGDGSYNSVAGQRLWPHERLDPVVLALVDETVVCRFLPQLRARVVLQRADGMVVTLFDGVGMQWDRFESMGGGVWYGFLSWNVEIPVDEDAGSLGKGSFSDSMTMEVGMSIMPVRKELAKDTSFFGAESAGAECVVTLESMGVMFCTDDADASARWLRFLHRLDWW